MRQKPPQLGTWWGVFLRPYCLRLRGGRETEGRTVLSVSSPPPVVGMKRSFSALGFPRNLAGPYPSRDFKISRSFVFASHRDFTYFTAAYCSCFEFTWIDRVIVSLGFLSPFLPLLSLSDRSPLLSFPFVFAGRLPAACGRMDICAYVRVDVCACGRMDVCAAASSDPPPGRPL